MSSSSDAAAHPTLVGRTLGGGRYRIEELVGGGSMGDVYRGRHVGLGTDIAVKIMRASVADDPKFKERFYREAKAASRLIHPNSVRVIDFGQEDDGLVYLTMEFLRGRDLLTLLRAEHPLSDDRIIDILAQTLAALSVAHGNGIVHRDLKPENIMVVADEDDDTRDCVKVCDFGIAKITDARAFKSNEDVTTALTVGHALIGTPEYMSPEQARGDALDARADLYAVGVVLYRMLTGRLPFEAENVIGLAVKHIMEAPKPPSQVQANVNPRLEAICLRAMQKSPAERYASAKEMRAELRSVTGNVPSAISTPSPGRVSAGSNARSDSGGAASNRAANSVESAATINYGYAGSGSSPPGHPHQSTTLALDDTQPKLVSNVTKTLSDDEPLIIPGHHRGGGAARVAMVIGFAILAGAGVWLMADGRIGRKKTIAIASASASSPTVLASMSPDDPNTALAPATTLPTMPGSPRTTRIGTAPTRTAPSTAVATAHAPSTSPPLPLPAPPTTTAATTPTATTPAASDYKPTNASVTLLPVVAERVQRDVVEKKMGDFAPRINSCYRDALFIAGVPVSGNAEIQMSIDGSGHVVSIVIARQLPPFQRCVSLLLSGMTVPTTAVDSGGGSATQSLKLNP